MSGSGRNNNTSHDLSAVLDRLCDLLKEGTGQETLPVRPGCASAEIARLESVIGVELPDDYKTLLRRVDGQDDWTSLTFPPDQLAMLSVNDVLSIWRSFVEEGEPDTEGEFGDKDRVTWILYHPKRIPIAYNEAGGVYLCLDYVPGPAGHQGQLVFNENEVDVVVLEPSVLDLIMTYVKGLETGAFRVGEKPEDHGEGFWFTAAGRYVDLAVYREVKAALSGS